MLGDGYNERPMMVIICDGLIATDWLSCMHVTLKRKKKRKNRGEKEALDDVVHILEYFDLIIAFINGWIVSVIICF